MVTKRIDELTAHPRSSSSPLSPSTAEFVVRDSALVSDNTRKITLEALRGGKVLAVDDFGGDLTAALSAAAKASPCLLLFGSNNYTWPAGVELPLGVSLMGVGGAGSIDGKTGGTRISSTGSVIQATGPERGTIIENLCFADGLTIKKQHTTVIGCTIAGAGVTVGAALSSPYYSRFVNCIFAADAGGTCITLATLCNGVTVQGSLQIPQNGRGVHITGGATGNKLDVAVDYTQTGDPMTGDIASVFYLDNAFNNYLHAYYWEDRLPAQFRDGAHIVFSSASAFQNHIAIQTFSSRVLVYHTTQNANNLVEMARGDMMYRNADFDWTSFFSRHVVSGAATTVYLPPISYRQGSLVLVPQSTVTLRAAYVVSATVVHAAGYGGLPGTYYQNYTDSNVVSPHHCRMKIVIGPGGMMSSVALLYPGWFRVQGQASAAVAVGNLSGGVINLTWTLHSINYGNESFTLAAGSVHMLHAVGDDTTWYLAS
jgi:hypothetical protein